MTDILIPYREEFQSSFRLKSLAVLGLLEHASRERISLMGGKKTPINFFCYPFLLIVPVSKAVLVLSGNGLLNNIRGFSTMRFWTSEIIFKHSNKKISKSGGFFFERLRAGSTEEMKYLTLIFTYRLSTLGSLRDATPDYRLMAV